MCPLLNNHDANQNMKLNKSQKDPSVKICVAGIFAVTIDVF